MIDHAPISSCIKKDSLTHLQSVVDLTPKRGAGSRLLTVRNHSPTAHLSRPFFSLVAAPLDHLPAPPPSLLVFAFSRTPSSLSNRILSLQVKRESSLALPSLVLVCFSPVSSARLLSPLAARSPFSFYCLLSTTKERIPAPSFPSASPLRLFLFARAILSLFQQKHTTSPTRISERGYT